VGLHDLFDRVADAAREYVDLIAERGVALGGIEGTVQTVARRSNCPSTLSASASGPPTSSACERRWRLSARMRGARSMRRPTSKTRTPPISSQKCRAGLISYSGWSKHTFKSRNATVSGGRRGAARGEMRFSAETIRRRESPTTSDRHKANRKAQRRSANRGCSRWQMKQRSSNDYASSCERR
jgi:hypothetical protein